MLLKNWKYIVEVWSFFPYRKQLLTFMPFAYVLQNMFLKISQNSWEMTCAGLFF